MKIKDMLEISRELLGSLLFPLRCPVCDEILLPEEIEKGIHSVCENRLYPIYGAVCMHCGRPLGDKISKLKNQKVYMKYQEGEDHITREYCYDCIEKEYIGKSFLIQGKALYLYKGSVKLSMYRFKYSNKREYAIYFSKVAQRIYGDWIKSTGVEAIIPVPIHKSKERKRGYNQAESFARALGKLVGLPVNTDLVYRIKNTIPQKGLSSLERKKNLEQAFRKGKSKARYQRVLLVDDIYTTGSTAEAVAKELKSIGIEGIFLLTICIGE